MLEHIKWVMNNTVVQHCNEDEVTELLCACCSWLELLNSIEDASPVIAEVADFEYSLVDRLMEVS